MTEKTLWFGLTNGHFFRILSKVEFLERHTYTGKGIVGDNWVHGTMVKAVCFFLDWTVYEIDVLVFLLKVGHWVNELISFMKYTYFLCN